MALLNTLSRWGALAAVLALLVGCGTLTSLSDRVTGAQARKEKEVAAVRTEYDGKLAANTTTLNTARDTQLAAKDAQMKTAAGSLYGSSIVFGSIPSPTRTDLLFGNLANEAWTALGHIQPTAESMAAMNARLVKELDATKTSLSDLQTTHQAAVTAAQKVTDTALAATTQVIALEKERATLETAYRTQLDAKQTELVALTKQKAALEEERANDRAAIQAMKAKASTVLGIIALVCLAGTIYSPIGKGGLATLGGVCALAAVALWFIQPWMVGAAVGAVILGALGYGYYRHHASDKTVSALVGYLHEKGQLATADLAQWTTRYAKAPDGSLMTVPDKDVLATIQSKLIATDRA